MTIPNRCLVTTLALVALAVSWGLFERWDVRQRPPRPAPHAAVAPRPASLSPPLSARDILARAAVLGLRAEQAARLGALDRLWRAESAGLEGHVERAVAEFARFMQEAQRSRGTSLAEIQRRSVELQEMSAELRARRWRHAGEAAAVLDDPQRRRLELQAESDNRGEVQ